MIKSETIEKIKTTMQLMTEVEEECGAFGLDSGDHRAHLLAGRFFAEFSEYQVVEHAAAYKYEVFAFKDGIRFFAITNELPGGR